MSTELGPRQRAAATKRRRTIGRITDAAHYLFDAHGWQAVTYEDVAKEANVSTGTVLNHFATKQALALGAYASVLLPIVDRAETALVNETGADAVTGFILEVAAAAAMSPALAVALLPAGRDIKPTKATVESDEIIIVDFDQLADLLGRLLEESWKGTTSPAESASDVAEFFLLGLLSRIMKHPEQSGAASANLTLDHLL